MTALEYGKQNFGDYALNNQINNIKVFCDTMQVDDDESQNELLNNPDYVYMECEYVDNPMTPFYQKKENGNHLPIYVVDYLQNSNATPITKKTGLFNKPEGGLLATTEILEIEDKSYVYYNRTAAGINLLPEAKIKRIKINRPLFNISDILKDKQISVVVFISSDGALLESAYQKIDTVFKNEVIILVESNDSTNLFNSVIRVKTGENVTLNANFPSKQFSQIANIFKLDIDPNSIQEIIQKHFTEKETVIYAIKKRFFGGSRIVVLAINIILEPFVTICNGLSSYLDTLKLDDSQWQYYDNEGNPVQKPNLFLPGLALLEQLEQANKETLIDESNYKLLIKNAVAILTTLNDKLKQTAFEVHPKIKKMMQTIQHAIVQFIRFLTNPTSHFAALAKQHFILVNAYIVGIINGLIEAIKGIFELLSLGIQLLQKTFGAINTTAALTGSVLVMFVEMIENTYECCVNLFSKENLETIIQFFKDAFVFIATLPSRIYNWITQDDISITLDRVGYYLGYLIGTVAEIILEILATGGAATVAEAIQKLSKEILLATQSIGKTLQKGARATAKGFQISFEFLLSFFKYISEKSKNLKPFFEEFWQWINALLDAAKAKIILSSGVVLHCEIIPISAFANRLKNILKARWLIQLEGLGLVIAKQSDDIYSFVYKGVEIFKGTKTQAETALKEYFEDSKKGGLEKYLDEVLSKIFVISERCIEHIAEGHIRIKKFKADKIVDEYEYLATSKGRIPEKGFNYSPTVGGFHILSNLDNQLVRIIENIGTKTLPTGETVRFTKVEYWVEEMGRWIPKKDTHTFFPSKWDKAKIKNVLEEASKNSKCISGNKFRGISKSGYEVEFYIDSTTREIQTAYLVFLN